MIRNALLALCLALPAGAQSDTSKTLFTARDGKIALGVLGASAAISWFDPKIASFFRDSSLGHVPTGHSLAKRFTRINETTLTVAGIAAYGFGRITKNHAVTDIAFHATEAVFMASVASQLIRGPLGRTRPHVTDFKDQYDFEFFKGFSEFNNRAFPSIHSGSGFAVATVLVQETRRRRPKSVKYVAPIAYGLALTPGLSRLYLGQHWASDVFAGAFMGTFAGMKVVNYSHTHPTNRIDDLFIPSNGFNVGMQPGGTLSLSWGKTW